MKKHLKRLPAPKTWMINRNKNKFILRARPGQKKNLSLPLGLIIRDFLQFTSTMSEVKKLLNTKEVLVDGQRRKDHHFMVGLFDVIIFKDLKQQYRLSLDNQGRLIPKEIPAPENSLKPCKIIGKSMVAQGKIQYHLHDGKNIFMKEKAAVGDTVLLTLPQLEVQEVLPLKPEMMVFLTQGKHSGDFGKIKEIKAQEVQYTIDKRTVETAKKYAFIVGEKKAAITL